MKSYKILAIGIFSAAMCGCSSDGSDDPTPAPQPSEGDVTVTITTEVLTKANVTTTLGAGDEMNVWAKTYGRLDAPDMVDGVKAVCNGSTWTMTPEVKLSEGKNAFIYAVAPYDASYTDPSAIPVDIADQIDLLYSGSYVPVSYTTHNAKLTMKHALSLASFNISAQGYSGNGSLTSMSISGDKVYTKGTMSVDNGKIAGTAKDACTLTLDKKITSAGWTSELPQLWQIPFSTKVDKAVLTVVIDGKTYETAFPEVEMKSGFQYVFRLVLTDYGLEFIPGAVETISLNIEEDNMTALDGYGVLSIGFSGTEMTIPTFAGDDVFGTISWGDGTADSYAPGTTHLFAGTGSTVVVESWNSTGFEFKELSGIETLDLTNY